MKFKFTAFVLSLWILFAKSERSEEIQKENYILIVNDNNFEVILERFKNILIIFYSPQSQISRKYMPQLYKIAYSFKKQKLPIYIGKVNALKNRELTIKFKIEGFPTIFQFADGENKEIVYKSGLTEIEIFKTFQKIRNEPIKKHKRVIELYDEINYFETSVVYFGNLDKNSNFALEFSNLNQEFDSIYFTSCPTQECTDFYRITENSVVLFKNHTKEKLLFENGDLLSFIKNQTYPDYYLLDEIILQKFFGEAKQSSLFFILGKDSISEDFENFIRVHSKKFRGMIDIIIVKKQKGVNNKFIKYFKLDEKDLPVIRIIENNNILRNYCYEQNLTIEKLFDFISSWKNNSISECITKDNGKGQEVENGVKILVDSTFEPNIKNENYNVLVLFYTRECPHCNDFLKVYEEFSKDNEFILENKLLVTKINVDRNDIDLPIFGYPHLKIWKINSKSNPVEFEDEERTIISLKKFVNINLENNKNEF